MTPPALPRRLMDRIILYGALAVALGAIFTSIGWAGKAYMAVSGALGVVARVDAVEERQDDADDQLWEVRWWVAELGKKAGVPPPPARPRRRDGRRVR